MWWGRDDNAGAGNSQTTQNMFLYIFPSFSTIARTSVSVMALMCEEVCGAEEEWTPCCKGLLHSELRKIPDACSSLLHSPPEQEIPQK